MPKSDVLRATEYQARQINKGLCYHGDGYPATHGRRCLPCYLAHLKAKRIAYKRKHATADANALAVKA